MLRPAPGVGLLEPLPGTEVRAGPAAGGGGVPVPADGVRRPLGERRVDVAQEVADVGDGPVGGVRGLGEVVAQRLGAGGHEAGEVGAGQPLVQLGDDGAHLPGSDEQAPARALLEALPEPPVRLRHPRHPAGDDGPVLVGDRRHEAEDLADRVHRAEQVRQGPQPLARLVRGQLGTEPLAQQPRTAPLDRVVGQRRVLGEHPVQLGQGLPGQRGLGLQPGRARVRQPVVAGAGAERGRDDRVEVADGVDVGVGDLARGWQVVIGSVRVGRTSVAAVVRPDRRGRWRTSGRRRRCRRAGRRD